MHSMFWFYLPPFLFLVPSPTGTDPLPLPKRPLASLSTPHSFPHQWFPLVFFFSSRSVGEGVFIRAIKAILVHPLYCWSIRGRAIDASPTGGYAAIIYSQHSDQLWAYGKRSSSDLNWCQHWSMGTNSSLGGNLIGTSCPFSKNNSFPTRACWPPQAQVLIGSVVPDVNFLLCSSLKAVGRPTMGSPRLYLWAYHAWTVDILTHKVHPC